MKRIPTFIDVYSKFAGNAIAAIALKEELKSGVRRDEKLTHHV